MKRYFFLFSIAFSVFFLGCGTAPETKEEQAGRVAAESCEEFSLASREIVHGLFSGLAAVLSDGDIQDVNTGSLGELPANWCECFTYFVAKDFNEKFTQEELDEIEMDQVKKMMVLKKIFEKRGKSIQQCVQESTNKVIDDYDKFSKDLDEKFKE